jgi:hypothetical protein
MRDDFLCVGEHSDRRWVVAAENAFDDLVKEPFVGKAQLFVSIRNSRQQESHIRTFVARPRKNFEPSRDPLRLW